MLENLLSPNLIASSLPNTTLKDAALLSKVYQLAGKDLLGADSLGKWLHLKHGRTLANLRGRCAKEQASSVKSCNYTPPARCSIACLHPANCVCEVYPGLGGQLVKPIVDWLSGQPRQTAFRLLGGQAAPLSIHCLATNTAAWLLSSPKHRLRA
jgi:hypothetical protein